MATGTAESDARGYSEMFERRVRPSRASAWGVHRRAVPTLPRGPGVRGRERASRGAHGRCHMTVTPNTAEVRRRGSVKETPSGRACQAIWQTKHGRSVIARPLILN